MINQSKIKNTNSGGIIAIVFALTMWAVPVTVQGLETTETAAGLLTQP